LEPKIAKNKDLYYDALGQSQQGWREGELKREGNGKNTCYYRLK
jgi:hypothetical protein